MVGSWQELEIMVYRSIKKKFSANVKHVRIGCLFGIWLIINGIIYWFSTLCWKGVICEDLRFGYRSDEY